MNFQSAFSTDEIIYISYILYMKQYKETKIIWGLTVSDILIHGHFLDYL